MRSDEATHANQAQRAVAHFVDHRHAGVPIGRLLPSWKALTQLGNDRIIGPDRARAGHVRKSGREIHRVAIGVTLLVYDGTVGHADLQAHAQRWRPFLQAFGMALLHENRCLDRIVRGGKLGQYAITQVFDDAPMVGLAHPPNPLRYLGNHVGDLRVVQLGIGSRAVRKIDEDHGDRRTHCSVCAAPFIDRQNPLEYPDQCALDQCKKY